MTSYESATSTSCESRACLQMDDLVFSDVLAGFVLLDERHRQKLSSFTKRSGPVGFPEVQDDPHELLARHAHLFPSEPQCPSTTSPDGAGNGPTAGALAADEDEEEAARRRRALAYYDAVVAEASSTYRFLGLHMWPPFPDDKKLEPPASFPATFTTPSVSLQPASVHLNLFHTPFGGTVVGNLTEPTNNGSASAPQAVSSSGMSAISAILPAPANSQPSEPVPPASPAHLFSQRADRSSPSADRPPEIVEFPEHRLAGKLWTDLGLIAHFLRLAFAIYGWPLFLVTQPLANYVNLYTNLQYASIAQLLLSYIRIESCRVCSHDTCTRLVLQVCSFGCCSIGHLQKVDLIIV